MPPSCSAAASPTGWVGSCRNPAPREVCPRGRATEHRAEESLRGTDGLAAASASYARQLCPFQMKKWSGGWAMLSGFTDGKRNRALCDLLRLPSVTAGSEDTRPTALTCPHGQGWVKLLELPALCLRAGSAMGALAAGWGRRRTTTAAGTQGGLSALWGWRTEQGRAY